VNYICKISHALENHLKVNTQRTSFHREPLPAVVTTPLTSLPISTRPQVNQQHVLLDRSKNRVQLPVQPNLFPSNYNNSFNNQRSQQLSPSASEPTPSIFTEYNSHFARPNSKHTTRSGPLLSTRVRDSSLKPFVAPQNFPSRESLVEEESFFRPFGGGQSLKRNEFVSTSFSHSTRDTSFDENDQNRFLSFNSYPLTSNSLDSNFPLDQFHHCNLMALEQSAIPLQSTSWSVNSSPPNYHNYHNNKFKPTFCQGPQIW